jgi:hypothetical protein
MTAGTRGGRAPGQRNKRTQALLDLVEEGESPCGFALRIMRDDATPIELKVQAAKLAAPYVHPRPQPEPRLVSFTVPEQIQSGDLVVVHETLIRATAAGEIAIEDARDISQMLETHRRLVETVALEERIIALEKAQEARP